MILRTIVRKMNHTGVCMITCVRRGRSPDPRDSTTTVLVICNSEKPLSHREHSIVKIRELLDSNYLSGVAVNFVRGDFVRGASGLNAEELDRRAIQLPSMPGQSLALNNASGSGTLGGFLELKMPGEAKYRICPIQRIGGRYRIYLRPTCGKSFLQNDQYPVRAEGIFPRYRGLQTSGPWVFRPRVCWLRLQRNMFNHPIQSRLGAY